MRKYKMITWMMAGCILTASVTAYPSLTLGATTIESELKNNLSIKNAAVNKDKLTELTKKVKSKITIPTDLTEFTYNLSENETISYWNLVWKDKENNKTIRVSVDVNGRISSYRYEDNTIEKYSPKYKKGQLKAKADAFMKKASPEIYKNTAYVDASFQGMYFGRYVYQYERVENGVAMPENTIRVGINYETGEVTSYSVNWNYDLDIPSQEVKLKKQEAIQKIQKEVIMELQYKTKYNTANSESTDQAYLVYVPSKTYISINAKNGTIYDTKTNMDSLNSEKSEMTEESTSNDGAMSSGALTDKEIAKIDEIKNVITKEKAINLVKNNKNLLLDEELTEVTANLYQKEDSNTKTSYIWKIRFSDPRDVDYAKNDYYRGYATATIDAKSGTILSYHASIKDYDYYASAKEVAKKKYNEKECQTIFEAFAKSQASDYWNKTIKSEVKESNIITYTENKKEYGGYEFLYNRINKKIPYADNYILGAVDGITGKIYSYDVTWNDKVKFEEPDNCISEQEAFGAYIEKEGFRLIYEINTTYSLDKKNVKSEKKEVRLVYNTNITPANISPFTGKQLNYTGEVYVDEESKYSYSDISGHKSQESIELLADLGIGFTGGSFEPEKAITGAQLYTFYQNLNLYNKKVESSLKGKNTSITRLDAAKQAIQILGFESVAEVQKIYQLDCVDKDSIKNADIGYVALAQGFGLLDTDEQNKFNPSAVLTRAEAAELLIQMLNIK